MPPRLPPILGVYRQAVGEPYVCRSCLLKAASGRIARRTRVEGGQYLSSTPRRPPLSLPRLAPGTRVQVLRKHERNSDNRQASNGSLASETAINAPTTVPSAYRELHQRLQALQEAASSYVDLSRLQLATRSLESSDPVIRVALLGLGRNGALAARRLARVLASDALGQQEAWEGEIVASANGGRSLLLKYGDAEDVMQSSPLVKTMNVPSPFLLRNKLEILVTTLNVDGTSPSSTGPTAIEEAILVPSLTIPNSDGSRVGFVRFPVHKAVIVAEGIPGAVEYGRFPAAVADSSLIDAALSVPLRPSSGTKSAEEAATGNAVDIDLATHALELFRTSKANGAQFSEEWQISRVSALSEWIATPSERKTGPRMNSAVDNLIASLLSNTKYALIQAQNTDTATATALTVPETKRTTLQSAISAWSADAHHDLQTNLDTAFSSSPSWRRTTWWRLFWRIDDVTLSASDVLRQSWLTEAEQRLAFLSGRISEAGLANDEQLRGPMPQLLLPARRAEMEDFEANKAHIETAAELLQMPSMLSRMQQQSGVNALFNPPWPQTINLSRQHMLRTLVPDMHRKAQSLLVTTLSTIGGSAALAAWFYVVTAGLGLYESGAIVSLGLVWGLRRLQKLWGKERDDFALTVREDARRVLGEVESHLRRVVQEGGQATVRPEEVRSWQEAKDAISRCREALQKLRADGPE